MPCRNSHGVVETLNRFDQGGLPKNAIPCILKGADGTATYNMVVTARRKRDPGRSESKAPEDRFIGFATNLPWVDVIIYAVRWGIESAYAQIEAMRAKTRSRNPGARLFCFIYSADDLQCLGNGQDPAEVPHLRTVPVAPPGDDHPADLQGDRRGARRWTRTASRRRIQLGIGPRRHQRGWRGTGDAAHDPARYPADHPEI